MADTIFTKIIKGEIPCHKVYEDDKTLAFMDIHPTQPGQVLVISKLQVETLNDLPDIDYFAVWATVQKVSKRLNEIFPAKKRVGIIVEGLDVPHVHVKVFPFNTADEFRHIPDDSKEPDHQALEILARKLAF
jgi:histidine triad (HIT) family protein